MSVREPFTARDLVVYALVILAALAVMALGGTLDHESTTAQPTTNTEAP